MAQLFLKFLLILTLFSPLWEKFNRIAISNRVKSNAEYFFKNGNYEDAAICFDSLITYFEIDDEKVHLNLAHCYFKNEDRKRAAVHYTQLSKSLNKNISSIANQQLGLIATMKGKNDEAISFFKRALLIDPTNENARYNLELIKKLKEMEIQGDSKASSAKGNGNNKGGGNQKGNKPTEGTSNKISDYGSKQSEKGQQEEGGNLTDVSESGKENKGSNAESDKDSENKDEDLKQDEKGNKEDKALRAKRLSEINISQEKARMILEEMKNEEVQYFQQLKKQTYNKNYTGKPEW